MYNQLTPEIIRQLKAVSDYVFLGDDINPDYAKDEMPIYGTRMPDVAIQPRQQYPGHAQGRRHRACRRGRACLWRRAD